MSVTFPTWKIKNPWLLEANSKPMEVNGSLAMRKFHFINSSGHQVTLYVGSNSFSYTDNIFSSNIINNYK